MGVNNTEVWNNLGMCCFYASQVSRVSGCLNVFHIFLLESIYGLLVFIGV